MFQNMTLSKAYGLFTIGFLIFSFVLLLLEVTIGLSP
jgi:hypothetical protein